jgi:hypothetical protein
MSGKEKPLAQRRVLGVSLTRRRYRLGLRGILVSVGLVSGYAVTLLVDSGAYLWSLPVFSILLVATLVEFVFADYLAERRYPHDTERKLDLLEHSLGSQAVDELRSKIQRTISSFEACDQSCISGTVHVTVDLMPSAESPKRNGLIQLTEYVGSSGGSKGRITTLEKGIVGRCARTGRREVVNFTDQEDYLNRMVQEFGFTKEEAASHTTSARSYVAEPLMSADERPIGVLYFFSTEPQVFPHAAGGTELSEVAQDMVAILRTVSIV